MGEKIRAEDILPQLRKVRQSGRGWTSCCPAHEDRRPSLSIANGDRGLMLHCFTGCSADRIKAALGIDTARSVFVPAPKPRPIIAQAVPDLASMWDRWVEDTDFHFLDGFAMTLSVDADALRAIGCAWNGSAWAFPMRDAAQRMIGIRLRASDGKKWAIKGSHQGLFIPSRYPYCIDDGTMYLTEGPTDLAAAMTLGLYSFGRPSCLGQEDMILAYLRNTKARRLVIVADNDSPGLEGARKLQSRLRMRSCIYVPPTKDLREFAIMGGDANLIESSIRDLVWRAA